MIVFKLKSCIGNGFWVRNFCEFVFCGVLKICIIDIIMDEICMCFVNKGVECVNIF